MDDARLMRAVERARNLDSAREGFVERQRATSQPRRQGLALEHLQYEKVDAGLGADIVDRADVGVVECGNCSRLALEALAPGLIAAHVLERHLDGDFPPQTRVLCAEDLPHPARAKRAGYFVWTEASAGTDRHEEGEANYTTPRQHPGVLPTSQAGRSTRLFRELRKIKGT